MNFLKTIALLSFLTALFTIIGYLVMDNIIGAIIGLFIASAITFFTWFYADKIVLEAYRVQVPTRTQIEVLKPIVETLCYRANLPLPKIYVIPTPMANAFATGRNPDNSAIAVTEGLIKLLSTDELEAVLAHELCHIKNRDTLTQTIAATLAGAISIMANMIYQYLWSFRGWRNSPIRLGGSLLTVLLAPISATIIQMTISRTREYAADRGAAYLTGNPRALANALERITNNSKITSANNACFAPLLIVNPFQDKSIYALFSTHPPVEARVRQLLKIQSEVKNQFMAIKKSPLLRQKQTITSIAISLSALGVAYAPLPGLQQTVAIVSGTELQAPLQELATQFQQKNPNIKIELKFQGSQDIVNNYIDTKNEQKSTILIPASSEFLDELRQRYTTQNNSDPFLESPQPIAKTLLVGVAWSERGKVLFPNGRFSWQRVEQAMQAPNWQAIGGQKDWGSFDFMMTDPSRSNSGQVTLSLWSLSKFGGNNPNNVNFSNPTVSSLFGTIKRSVYQPPRSTDILLQEFIARAPNDADVATVYESLALSRWQQSSKNQGKPYQIYYLDPTIETVATAVILRQNVDAATASAAKSFISYLREPEQQKVFVQHGFRPAIDGVNLQGVANSPWNQNIPGVELNPSVKAVPVPKAQIQAEIQRIWQRAN